MQQITKNEKVNLLAEKYNELGSVILEIELKIFNENKNDYSTLLIELRNLIVACVEGGKYAELFLLENENVKTLATRMTHCFTNILLEPKFTIPARAFIHLSEARRYISNLYEISGYSGSSYVKNILINRKKNEGLPSIRGLEEIIRLSLLCSLDDIYPEIINYLTSKPNGVKAIMALSLLSDRIVLTEIGENNRTKLLNINGLYENLNPDSTLMLLVSRAWMYSSYAITESKHHIKIHLNQWFKKIISEIKIDNKCDSKLKLINYKEKPLIIVAAEIMRSGHAMFRWYMPLILELKKTFKVVLVASKNDVDQGSIALFDEYFQVENISDIQKLINSYHPLAVYFPSIGMRYWAIALGNMRWAPLQLVSLGHPSSSYIDTIDAVIADKVAIENSECFSENLIGIDAKSGGSISYPKFKIPRYSHDYVNKEIMEIAIPCITFKINHAFIKTLKNIEKNSVKKIIYTFYPNEYGLSYVIKNKLKYFFPTSKIEKRMTYEGYIDNLAKKDFALSPFPFGNSSSAFDCLLAGLPVIAMDGAEPHSKTDRQVLAQINLNNELIFEDIKDYENMAINFLNNVKDLIKFKEKLNVENIQSAYGEENSDFAKEFAAAFCWAVENKDELNNSKNKTFLGQGRWL